MAQRITTQRQLYFGVETTEGTEVLGTATQVLSPLNLTAYPDLAFNARQVVGQLGNIAGKIGQQTDPSLSFTMQARCGGTAITPRVDPLLAVVLGPGQLDSGSTTIQAGSTSTIMNVASAANFSVGNALAIETGNGTGTYEVGWIQATSTSGQNTITLTHALTFTPVASATVKPSITYKPMNAGHGSLSFQMWLDSNNRVSFTGCKGTMKVDVPGPGAIPTLTFNCRAMSFSHVGGGSRPTPTYDTSASPTPYKLKIDSTPADAKLASWDLRQTVARKRSQNSANGTLSQLITNRDLMGYIQLYDIDEAQFASWSSGTEQALSHQFGSTPFNVMAYQMLKAQRTDVVYGDDNGLTTDILSFEGHITDGADEVRLAFM